MKNKVVKHKGPKKPKTTRKTSANVRAKETPLTRKEIFKNKLLKLKIIKNNFLNKYYYSFKERYSDVINRTILKGFYGFLNYIRICVWGIILLFVLLLFNYNITLLNYLSSVAVILVLTPVTTFVYKIFKVE